MNGIAAFIAARLDEWEALDGEVHEARVCSGCRDGWEAGFDPDRCDCGYPAVMLREVAALRAILALADEADQMDEQLRQEFGASGSPLLGEQIRARLATFWADHPDYQQEWQP